MKLFNLIITTIILTVMGTSPASADLYYETSIMRPGNNITTVSKTFFSDTGLRFQASEQVAHIINFENETYFELNLKDKTYKVTKLEIVQAPEGDGDKSTDSQAGGIFNQMFATLEVTKTDETQIINGYNCTKMLVTNMGSTTEHWITSDLPEYGLHLSRIEKFKESMIRNQYLSSIWVSYEMFKKTNGLSMKAISKIMRQDLTSQIVKVEKEPIDPKMFMPPEDFSPVKTTK